MIALLRFEVPQDRARPLILDQHYAHDKPLPGSKLTLPWKLALYADRRIYIFEETEHALGKLGAMGALAISCERITIRKELLSGDIAHR